MAQTIAAQVKRMVSTVFYFVSPRLSLPDFDRCEIGYDRVQISRQDIVLFGEKEKNDKDNNYTSNSSSRASHKLDDVNDGVVAIHNATDADAAGGVILIQEELETTTATVTQKHSRSFS